jgi:hypothetical protein
VSAQTAEDPNVCLGIRTLATGSELDCLDESMAGRSTPDTVAEVVLAEFPDAAETVIQVSTSFRLIWQSVTCARQLGAAMTDENKAKPRKPAKVQTLAPPTICPTAVRMLVEKYDRSCP